MIKFKKEVVWKEWNKAVLEKKQAKVDRKEASRRIEMMLGRKVRNLLHKFHDSVMAKSDYQVAVDN